MLSDKKKILNHLQNEVFCRLGSSKTHGVGVFAIRAIKKDLNPLMTWFDDKEIKSLCLLASFFTLVAISPKSPAPCFSACSGFNVTV